MLLLCIHKQLPKKNKIIPLMDNKTPMSTSGRHCEKGTIEWQLYPLSSPNWMETLNFICEVTISFTLYYPLFLF